VQCLDYRCISLLNLIHPDVQNKFWTEDIRARVDALEVAVQLPTFRKGTTDPFLFGPSENFLLVRKGLEIEICDLNSGVCVKCGERFLKIKNSKKKLCFLHRNPPRGQSKIVRKMPELEDTDSDFMDFDERCLSSDPPSSPPTLMMLPRKKMKMDSPATSKSLSIQMKSGITNLGNTCFQNASLQVRTQNFIIFFPPSFRIDQFTRNKKFFIPPQILAQIPPVLEWIATSPHHVAQCLRNIICESK